MFKLRSLFDKSPFILSVVGEHLCSEWSFAGAPRRNVGILFGHRRYATTKQYNAVRMIRAMSRHIRKVRVSPLPSGEPISIGKQIDYGRCDVCEMASLEPTLIRTWKSRTSKEVL